MVLFNKLFCLKCDVSSANNPRYVFECECAQAQRLLYNITLLSQFKVMRARLEYIYQPVS